MNYSTLLIGLFIIIMSVIIQVGYYVAWMLCDSYFYPKNVAEETSED